MRIGNRAGCNPTWKGAIIYEAERNSSENGETMISDDVSEVKNDPDREARKALPMLA
jgi:hypothetical protein